jgi:ABC-2 type transport system permease protein
MVNQIVDGFAGAKIATAAGHSQLSAHGAAADAVTLQAIAMQHADWSAELGEKQQAGNDPLFTIQAPAIQEEKANEEITEILGLVMAGMMVFYVFFTGAAAAQSILIEEEAGTLPRLFTTPTSQSVILGGKIASSFLLLTVQVVVLVLLTSWIFGVDWGHPVSIALVVIGLVVVASSFGIFVTSFLRDTRQGGIIYGGVMTVMGMVGMLPTFTAANPAGSSAFETASLVVPQGWGVRGWRLLLEGSAIGDVLPTVAVMLAAGLVFFGIGVLRFRKRYA